MQDVIVKKTPSQEKPKAQEMIPSVESIEWRAPEYEFRKKSTDWFWSFGIIAAAFIFSSIVFKNILFAVLILLGSFSLVLYAVRKPMIISFVLMPKGIKIGNKIYDYENLKSFWINYDSPQKKELLIESKKTFMPIIRVLLDDTDPEKIRNYLLKFLKEEKIEESLITTIARLLGF